MSRNGASGAPGRIVCLGREAECLLRLLGVGRRVVKTLESESPSFRGTHHAAGSALPVLVEGSAEEIGDLRPDLVAVLADGPSAKAERLAAMGLEVLAFFPRSVEEVLGAVRSLGEALGVGERGRELARRLEEGVEEIRERGEGLLRRPRVLFEERPDPLTAAGARVSELLELAGGEDIFRELRGLPGTGGRRVVPAEAARREPEAIVGAWRGESFDPERVRSRPGWDRVPAVRRGKIYGMEPHLILEPGPTALSRGLSRLHEILAEVSMG